MERVETLGRTSKWVMGVALVIVVLSILPGWLGSIPRVQLTATSATAIKLLMGAVVIASIAGSLFIPKGEPLAIWFAGIAASLVVFVLVGLFASCNDALSESGKEACAFEAGGYAIAPVLALLAFVPRLVLVGLRAGLRRLRQGIRDKALNTRAHP